MLTEYPVPISVDLNEGRYVELGCLRCHSDVRATLGIATPVRMYVVSLDCDDCGEHLTEWDQFMGVYRTWRSMEMEARQCRSI